MVAFPTETVYGIGAVAFSPLAVRKVFAAKNRPPCNPLLVHVSDLDQVHQLATAVPEPAKLLMKAFWPGPLSIILEAKESLPSEVTAGKKSVGLRMPSHPVARALIRNAGPIAATSANLSGRPSPINACHVKKDLDGKIAAVLDAGNTGLGLESTIIDFTGECQVLRRGGVPVEALEAVLGTRLKIHPQQQDYRFALQIIISESLQELKESVDKMRDKGKRVAIVRGESDITEWEIKSYKLDYTADKVNLYSILRDAEENGVEVLLFAPFPENIDGAGQAILDRIRMLPKYEYL